MRSPTCHNRRFIFPPALLVAGLLMAGGPGSQAHAQGHNHENTHGEAALSPTDATVAGVSHAFLERPLPLDPALAPIPHHVPGSSEKALAYYQQGLAYHHLYHYLNAVRSFNQALRLDPELLPAWAGLSRALIGLGARSEAEAVLQGARALSRTSTAGTAAEDRGRLFLELRALALEATSEEGRRRYQEALNRALESHPDDIEIRMLWALRARGEERLARLQEVLKRAPDHVGAHHQLVHTFESMGRAEEAVAHGARLAELAPGVAHGRHMYGHNLMRVGRVEDARREFAAADSLEREYFDREGIPEHYDWHHPHNLHLLALTHWHVGALDEAEATLRRRAALRDRRGRPAPARLLELGQLMAAEGRGREAVALAREILEGYEEASPQASVSRQAKLLEAEGWLLQGDVERAMEALAPLNGQTSRGRFGAWQARVDAQLRLHQGEAGQVGEALDGVLEDLRIDRGPDGWITSLLHLHALAWSAHAAGAPDVLDRVVAAMEEHDPTFQVRVPFLSGTGKEPGVQAATRSEGATAAASGEAPGGSVRELRTHPVEGPIRIDGRLSEPDWDEAPVAAGFVQQVPRPGQPATLDTEVRVLQGEDALYVGVRLLDPAPDSIVAQLARRGVSNESDWVYVAFDTHLDRRTAYKFGVNAAGVKRDLRIADDVRQDDSWDAVWDAAVARDHEGWTAEFRIPLSQLRFPTREGEQVWGFNVQRVVARSGEVSHWAPVERESGAYVSSFGRLAGVRLERGPRMIEALPYVTSRMAMAPGDPGNPYHSRRDVASAVGGDLRMALTPWLTLNATFNPDFGQVESDPAVVNLSAFETFLPERRPFFVDGAEHFRTPGSLLFYSRRIGRSPQLRAPSDALFSDVPDQTRILGAGKVTGRSPGGWSVGVMSALTARETAPFLTDEGEGEATVEPTTSYSFLRLGRDLRDGESEVNVTATATRRLLTDDPGMETLRSGAYVGGVDTRHRFGDGRFEAEGALYLSHVRGDSAAMTRTQRAPGRYLQRPDADHLTFRPDRTHLGGWRSLIRLARVAGGSWRWGTELESTSSGYEVNDLGLNFSVDETWQSAWLGYHEFAPGRLFRNWSVQVRQMGIWTHGGERIDVNGTLDLNAELHNRWRLGLWGMRHQGGIDPNHLRGGPAYFRPGNWMGRASVVSDRRRSVSANASLFAVRHDGSEGWHWRLATGVLWRPSDRSEVRVGPSAERSVDRSQFVTARNVETLDEPRYVLAELHRTTAALELRLNYALSPDLSVEMHARPFLSAGRFRDFHRVIPGRAREADRKARLAPYTPEELQVVTTPEGERQVEIDETGDGIPDIRFPHPDFNRKDLRSNIVLRWEFRPGSTFFLVWSHDRSRFDPDGGLAALRDADRLWRAPGRNVLAIKASYRLEW